MADIVAGAPITTSRTADQDCYTCKTLQTYGELAERYIDSLAGALYTPLMALFLSLVGFWAVFTGFKFWLALISPMAVLRDLFAIVIAYVLLSTHGSTLVTGIYATSLKVMTGAAITSFTIGPGSPGIETGTGIEGLMLATESGVSEVFGLAADVISNAGRLNPFPYVYAILLVLPYFLVVVVFFSKIVVSIFRLMMLGIFAPFLIIFFAFGWGRGMAIAGMKTLLSAMFVLFAAAVSVGLLLYGVDSIAQNLTPDDVAGKNLLSSDYLTVLILGWLGVALMTEGIGLANSITLSKLSNTAAGIITAGITGSATTIGKTAWNQGGGDALKGLLGGVLATPGREIRGIAKGAAEGTASMVPGVATSKALGGVAIEGISKAKRVLGFSVDAPQGSRQQ